MFNAVELVLMLMSMFSLVNLENRRAVWFLFEISLSYDMTTGRFRMTHRSYDAFLQLISPLSALASYRGMMYDETTDPSVMEAHGMIRAILQPILGCLNADELREMHDSAEEGLQLLFLDLKKFEMIVKTWTRDARDDGRLARWKDLEAASTSTASQSTSTSTNAPSAGIESPLARARAMLMTCWTPNVVMDDRIASSVLSYCAGFAAASTQVSVRRAQRVKPRKTAASGSTVFSIASPIPTLHRRNCVKTREIQSSLPTNDFAAPQVSLQRTSRVKTRSIQPSASSTDGDSFISSPGAWRDTLPMSSSAPELGASSMNGATFEGVAFAQHPYLLRRAASALVLSLGDDQFDTSSSSSSSSSIAWGIGCSPAELAADGHMGERVDTNSASRPLYDWTDYGRSSNSFDHGTVSPNSGSSGLMLPVMPETPLKRRRRDPPSSTYAFPTVNQLEPSLRSHSSDSGFDIDYPLLDSPFFQRSASFMEAPPTPPRRGVSCSFDSFKSVHSTKYYPDLGFDPATANTSQGHSSIILSSSENSLVELNPHGGDREAEWEMMTPPVVPVHALPTPVRALKRKRGMRDLRAGWGFPLQTTTMEPSGSQTMYATKVAADSRSCVGGFVRDAWWTTPGLDSTPTSSRQELVAPNVEPMARATPYHTCDSPSLLTASTASLCPSSPGTSLVSTSLRTPRSSVQDLPFAEWADEWEADQHSLWSSALVEQGRQFSEETIKPPRMNAATRLATGIQRRLSSVWPH